MTISVGTPSTDQDNGVSSVTFSHTVTAGKGRQLLVGVSFNNDNLETITGITYDGNALSLVIAHDRDDDSRAELWRLQDPPVGTANVVVTLDGTLTSNAGIISGATQFDEVDSTTPVGATASDDGDSAVNSVTVASNVGELAVEVSAIEQGSFDTIGAGQTLLWNLQAGSTTKIEDGASSYKAGASPNVTLEWDNDDDKWAMVAASLRPSVVPTVDAGGPYTADVDVPELLAATVTPGTDPAPTFLWTIDSGPGSGVFTPSATIEDPSFEADTVGSYTLKLTVSTVDAPDVSDTASFESESVFTAPTVDAGANILDGIKGVARALSGSVTPGSDPNPTILWTIDVDGFNPPGGSFLDDSDPTTDFTPNGVGGSLLKLEADPSDGPAVSDTMVFAVPQIPPTVDAGGPYSGLDDTPIALDATVVPGTDPAPALLWEIDSGPGSGVFLPSATVEDPTFTPDMQGVYMLKLTATPFDGPAVEDIATLTSTGPVTLPGQNLAGKLLSNEGDLFVIELAIGADPPADTVFLAGTAYAPDGSMYVVIDDGAVSRVFINGKPHQHNGVRIIETSSAGDVNLAGWRFKSDLPAQIAGSLTGNRHNQGIRTDDTGVTSLTEGTPLPVDPPLVGLEHRFNATYSGQLFANTGGTIEALRGDAIVRVDNLGASGAEVIDTVVNDLGPYVQDVGPTQDCQQVVEDLEGGQAVIENAWGQTGGVTGIAVAGVIKPYHFITGSTGYFSWGNIAVGITGDNFVMNFGGGTIVLGPLPEGDWVWFYGTIDAAGNYRVRLSGNAEQTGASTYIQPIAGHQVRLFGGLAAHAELLVYDHELTSAEINDLVAYFNNIYGTLPLSRVPWIPPRGDTLRHWYDLSEPCVPCQDLAGTTLAGDGDPVQLIKDRCYQGNAKVADLGSGSSAGPYNASGLNGLGTLSFLNDNLPGTDGVIGDPAAQTLAVVFKITGSVPEGGEFLEWGGNIGSLYSIEADSFGPGALEAQFGAFSQNLGPQTQDQWVWAYMTYNSSDDGKWRASFSSVEGSANFGTYFQVSAGELVRIMNSIIGDVGEALIWDRELLSGDIDELTTYFNNKWGAESFTPVPGGDLHHFDFTDRDTVFSDVAGTVPAEDNDSIQYVGNKGSDGTPLIQSVTLDAPIYDRESTIGNQYAANFTAANHRLANTIANGMDGTVNGTTIAFVSRMTNIGPGATAFNMNWNGVGANGLGFELDPTGTLAFRLHINGNSIVPSGGSSLQNNWYLNYVSLNTGFTWDYYTSPGPNTNTFNGANGTIPASSVLELITDFADMELAEFWIWPRALTVSELADLVAYADNKYQIMPHT